MFSSLAQSLGLGEIIEPALPVEGGLLHNTWHLKTEQGAFAVKQLNSSVLELLKPTVLPMDVTESIAKQMKSQDVPAITALTCSSSYLFNDEWVVHPWIAGQSINLSKLSVDQAHRVGQLLRKIHQTNIDTEYLPAPTWQGLSEKKWIAHLKAAEENQAEWAGILDHFLPKLTKWSQLATESLPTLNQILIITHRDLDAKNIIWQDNEDFTLIDWEYAGLMNPEVDLFAVAMSWSGISEGNINETVFSALLKGYGKPLKLCNVLLGGYLGYCMDWLIFNLHHGALLKENSGKIHLEIKNTLKAMELATEWY